MKIQKKAQKSVRVLTGTAIPLGALRSAKSCGVGEYPDVALFADFCKSAKLEAIQLLPVNDTGTESSPYSAQSAFALNPIYIHIEDLPEYDKKSKVAADVQKFRDEFESAPRFSYRSVLTAKLAALHLLYDTNKKAIAADVSLQSWIKENPWVASYSVYKELKRINAEASWKEWAKEFRNLTPKEIEKRWNTASLSEAHLFFAWVQFRADEQFKKAADYAASLGIIVKGDIPILMNEDSVDVWANPAYFNDSMRAGAPPDMYNAGGQNWGFPVYNWDALAKDGYSWWKNRLSHASRYYKAYRIDHILGFFRIWQTSESDVTAYLGRPDPIVPITKRELLKAGFDEGRIRWLSLPHVPTDAIERSVGVDYFGAHEILRTLLDKIDGEELWLFKREVSGEKHILKADIPQTAKDVLLDYWHNRAIVEVAKDEYSPLWTHEDSTAWNSLNEAEKETLEALFAKKDKAMEKLWEAHAREILGELVSSNDMIACAEDLGIALNSLPVVLQDLSILSLRVIRWARLWQKDGAPFVPPAKYPALSVVTLSVHDSSTTRAWWESEQGGTQYAESFKLSKKANATSYTPETAEYLLLDAAAAGSTFCIHPIQDFLALSATYHADDAQNERINIPGTVTNFNWTYRLPVTIETLHADKAFIGKIAVVADAHKKQKKVATKSPKTAKTSDAPQKRRGRPAKPAAEKPATASEPKRRGRPAKNVAEKPVKATTQKKRGRPAKPAAEKPATASVTTPVAGAEPKRRGRPAKSATEKSAKTVAPKPRGRPAKPAAEKPAKATESKRRGRPAKNAKA